MYLVIYLIISLLSFPAVQQEYDVLVLEHASVKGKFISYNHEKGTIKFYNIQSQDTDVIAVNEVKYLFYNTLNKSSYDTLYSSINKRLVGKIFYQDAKELVFWDLSTKKIQSLSPQDYINIMPPGRFKSFVALKGIYISLGVFLFIFAVSLLLSKDYLSSTLYFLFGTAVAFLVSIIQKIIKL